MEMLDPGFRIHQVISYFWPLILFTSRCKIDLKILSLSNDISIRLGNDPKPINTGIFGMNWADEFKNSSLPILYKDATGTLVEEPTSQAQWDWVAALTPEVVRIPSGSYS